MYKYSKPHKDPEIQKIQRETSDNFATNTDLNSKQKKVTDIINRAPTLDDLSDGEKMIYFDGTDRWKYERYGGQLFKTQMTKVT